MVKKKLENRKEELKKDILQIQIPNIDNVDFKKIREGEADFYIPILPKINNKDPILSKSNPIFYNPLQKINRDLSIVAFNSFFSSVDKKLLICDAFTGCGIRALRYAKEIPNISKIIANDINPKAVTLTKYNVKFMKLKKIKVTKKHASVLFLERFANSIEESKFDIIDIDPFGSPIPFIESSIHAIVKKNGIIALTATDMTVLCGVYPKVSYRKYGGWSIRAPFTHEIALRLLIGGFVKSALRFDKGINVLFAYYADHYVRAILEVKPNAKAANKSLKEMGYIQYCNSCKTSSILPIEFENLKIKCTSCGKKLRIAGPLFIGSIFNSKFLMKMKKQIEEGGIGISIRAYNILKRQIAESEGPPIFTDLHKICKGYSIEIPPIESVISNLSKKGFFASRTHFSPTSIRTNAPQGKIIELLKKK
ncbi:MAG: tRNA (guanine(10)-N(2))-dimethyltransferase [Candidatus Ranarchaeia archaeon]